MADDFIEYERRLRKRRLFDSGPRRVRPAAVALLLLSLLCLMALWFYDPSLLAPLLL